MPYKIAGIDIHKRVLMVVVASVADEVADATGAAMEFECRRFGTGASERQHLVAWLQQHQVREVVMESTAQCIGSRCGWIWSRILRSCIWRRRNPTARPKDARTTFGMPSAWRGACWPAN